MVRQFEGREVTAVLASPDVEVGSRRMYLSATYGWQELEYIQNKSAGTLSAGLGVMRKSSVLGLADISGADTPSCRMVGVAQWDIGINLFSWVLRKGFGISQSNATQTVNTAQKSAAAGQFTDRTIAGGESCVFAIGDDGGAAINVLSYIACP